jgi:hypothetical protein
MARKTKKARSAKKARKIRRERAIAKQTLERIAEFEKLTGQPVDREASDIAEPDIDRSRWVLPIAEWPWEDRLLAMRIPKGNAPSSPNPEAVLAWIGQRRDLLNGLRMFGKYRSQHEDSLGAFSRESLPQTFKETVEDLHRLQKVLRQAQAPKKSCQLVAEFLQEVTGDLSTRAGRSQKYPKAVDYAIELLEQGNKDQKIYRLCKERFGAEETLPDRCDSFMRRVRAVRRERRGYK